MKPTATNYLLVLLAVSTISSFVYYARHPYWLTPATTLYALGVAEKARTTDVINSDVIDIPLEKQAAFYFELAIDKGYHARPVFEELNRCYWRLGDRPQQERTLSRGLHWYPCDTEFLYLRATCRLERAAFGLALADYNNALAVSASFRDVADAYYERGAAEYMLGRKAAAAKDRARAQQLSGAAYRTYGEYCQRF